METVALILKNDETMLNNVKSVQRVKKINLLK